MIDWKSITWYAVTAMNIAIRKRAAMRNRRRLISIPVFREIGDRISEAVRMIIDMTAVHRLKTPRVIGRTGIGVDSTALNPTGIEFVVVELR